MQNNPSKVQQWVIQKGLQKGPAIKRDESERQELQMSLVMQPLELESHIESRPLIVSKEIDVVKSTSSLPPGKKKTTPQFTSHMGQLKDYSDSSFRVP